MDKTPEQRIIYPEAGDWVMATRELIFCCRYTVDRPGFTRPYDHQHFVGMHWRPGQVSEGTVGRLIREDFDGSYQSAHDCIVYVVDFGDGQERWLSFGEVVGTNLLDSIVRVVETK